VQNDVFAPPNEIRSPFFELYQYPLPFGYDPRPPSDEATRSGQQRDDDYQRPQAELKPAAFAFRRFGLGWRGHRHIIRRRARKEEGRSVFDRAVWQSLFEVPNSGVGDLRFAKIQGYEFVQWLESVQSGVGDLGPRQPQVLKLGHSFEVREP
jgi:hypothetical protein